MGMCGGDRPTRQSGGPLLPAACRCAPCCSCECSLGFGILSAPFPISSYPLATEDPTHTLGAARKKRVSLATSGTAGASSVPHCAVLGKGWCWQSASFPLHCLHFFFSSRSIGVLESPLGKAGLAQILFHPWLFAHVSIPQVSPLPQPRESMSASWN